MTFFFPPLNSVTFSVGTITWSKKNPRPAMSTRRNRPSRIDSSRLLCTLRMYQSILSDFSSGFSSAFLPAFLRLFCGFSSAFSSAFFCLLCFRRFFRFLRLRRRPALGDRRRRGGLCRGGAGVSACPSGCAAACSWAGNGVGSAGTSAAGGCAAGDSTSPAVASGGSAAAGSALAMFRSSITPKFLQDVQHFLNSNPHEKSNRDRTIAKEKITISTTIDARNNSDRVGQDTLFISASTAIRKSAKPGTLTTRYDAHRPAKSSTPGTRKRSPTFRAFCPLAIPSHPSLLSAVRCSAPPLYKPSFPTTVLERTNEVLPSLPGLGSHSTSLACGR